jgi:hypothetical protein
MNPARYAKAIVAALSAGLLTIQSVITMSDRSRAWVTVSIAVLAAVAVYVVPNAPGPIAASPPAAPGPTPEASTRPPPFLTRDRRPRARLGRPVRPRHEESVSPILTG